MKDKEIEELKQQVKSLQKDSKKEAEDLRKKVMELQAKLKIAESYTGFFTNISFVFDYFSITPFFYNTAAPLPSSHERRQSVMLREDLLGLSSKVLNQDVIAKDQRDAAERIRKLIVISLSF